MIHRLDTCRHRDHPLAGAARVAPSPSHQVIDLPPGRAEVTGHQAIRLWSAVWSVDAPSPLCERSSRTGPMRNPPKRFGPCAAVPWVARAGRRCGGFVDEQLSAWPEGITEDGSLQSRSTLRVRHLAPPLSSGWGRRSSAEEALLVSAGRKHMLATRPRTPGSRTSTPARSRSRCAPRSRARRPGPPPRSRG